MKRPAWPSTKKCKKSIWICNFSSMSPQTVASSCACLGRGCCWTTWGLLEDWPRWWFVQAPCKLWHSCKSPPPTKNRTVMLFFLCSESHKHCYATSQMDWVSVLAKLNFFQGNLFKANSANKNHIDLNRTVLKMYESYRGHLSLHKCKVNNIHITFFYSYLHQHLIFRADVVH